VNFGLGEIFLIIPMLVFVYVGIIIPRRGKRRAEARRAAGKDTAFEVAGSTAYLILVLAYGAWVVRYRYGNLLGLALTGAFFVCGWAWRRAALGGASREGGEADATVERAPSSRPPAPPAVAGPPAVDDYVPTDRFPGDGE
jgi:hypothetical protein